MSIQISFQDELIIDNFAGGGGASTGIELALGRPVDIAINHDPDAIAMHIANHPYTKHFCESVWEIDPRKVTEGRKVALCWLSPDCKHFSKAKGGKPVNKKIRGLAWVAVRWAATVHPRVIMLENVEEFKTWGPIKNGQPIKSQSGRTFRSFVNALHAHGYEVEWRELRACDFGAPTIRKRFFLIARCDGLPIVWPEPTHAAPTSEAVKSGRLKPWRTAAEIIDWSISCPSIFERKKPLAENTMRRIARGLQKFVFDNPQPFIIKIKGGATGSSINEPLHTITAGGEPKRPAGAPHAFGVVTPYIARIGQTGFGGDGMQYQVSDPLTTVVSKAEHLLIAPILTQYHSFDDTARGQQLGDPILTIDTSNRYALVSAFMAKHYGGGYTGSGNSPLDPVSTITAADHNAIVTSHLVKMKGTNIGQPVDEPIQTITAGGLHFGEVRAFLIKYYGCGTGQKVTEPLDTIVGKDRFGLVTIHGEDYQIVDIGMRMLEPKELFAGQGFPLDYIIDRVNGGKPYPKSAQVARCGNSVPPSFAEALVRANLPDMAARVQITTMAQLEKQIAV